MQYFYDDFSPAVLVNMLNHEKKKPINTEEDYVSRMQNNTNIPSHSKRKLLPQKEAFELFLRQDRNENEVSKCGNALRMKMQAAKHSADKIQTCKENIITLKKKLRENINNKPDVTNKLMSQLKCHQEIYRENILELYNLKKEAAHLSHGFQQAKRRVMRRFREWWEGFKKSTNVYELYNQNIGKSDSTSAMFSPKNSTDYFNWDPEVSSSNLEQPALQSVCNVDSFPSVFDSESMDQFQDFKFDSTEINQFKENNFLDRSHNELPMQFQNQNFNSQGDGLNFHHQTMPNFPPPMQRHDGNFINEMKNFSSDNSRQPIHRLPCDPNQMVMPNAICSDMNQQFFRQPQPNQQFMNTGRNSFNCFEMDPKGQLYTGGNGFNQFTEAYQQNYVNYDIPEKLPNYQKQSGFYGYIPSAYINKPVNAIPQCSTSEMMVNNMYHPNYANPSPALGRVPYEERRNPQYVDIAMKPGAPNNYYSNNNSQSTSICRQWNDDPRTNQNSNNTGIISPALKSPKHMQESNYPIINQQFSNSHTQSVSSSRSSTIVSPVPEYTSSNFKSCSTSHLNLNEADELNNQSQQHSQLQSQPQPQPNSPKEEVPIDKIPLTGDPEVDEEILSFYRTKNTVMKQANQREVS